MLLLFCEVSIFDPRSFAPLTPPLILLIHPCLHFFTSFPLNSHTSTGGQRAGDSVWISAGSYRGGGWLLRADRVKIGGALRRAAVSCGIGGVRKGQRADLSTCLPACVTGQETAALSFVRLCLQIIRWDVLLLLCPFSNDTAYYGYVFLEVYVSCEALIASSTTGS